MNWPLVVTLRVRRPILSSTKLKLTTINIDGIHVQSTLKILSLTDCELTQDVCETTRFRTVSQTRKGSRSKRQLRYLFTVEFGPLSNCLIPNFSLQCGCIVFQGQDSKQVKIPKARGNLRAVIMRLPTTISK